MEQSVIEFLVRAKRAACADSDPSGAVRSDFRYAEMPFRYTDTRMGGAKFTGREVLHKDGIPIWCMNRIGRVISDEFSGDFWKEALSLVSEDRPFRGPSRYQKGDYSYTCNTDGDLHWFYGYEFITYKGETVYECAFHGGDLS
ncbi:MAG: DUF5680 domain-containing protein [Eubacteriales bacterium]